MLEKHYMEYGTTARKWRDYTFYLTISLLVLCSLVSRSLADNRQPGLFPEGFGPSLQGTEGENQTLIDQLSKQLTSDPYRADLYYHLARAYDRQGRHEKAAQYMNQWIKLSNIDVVMKDSHAFMVDEKNDRILVVNKDTEEVVRKIDVGWFPRKIVPTPDLKKLYVTNALADSVSAVDTEKMAATKTIKAGRMPWNGKSSPQGDRVYVTNLKSDNVSVIDTKNNTVLETVKVGQGPWGIAISPDGHRLYVSNQDSRDIQVIDTGSYSIVDVINVGTNPRDIALAPDDEGKLYAVDANITSHEVEIYVVNLEDARVVKALNVPATDDPLLSRFNEMSLQDKLELIGGLVKSDERIGGPIEKPKIGDVPRLAVAPSSMVPSVRSVPVRDATAKQVELPMGGPAVLAGPEPLLKACVKVPAASVGNPLPSGSEHAAGSESAVPQEKKILRIIVVVRHDTLWQLSLDNYGVANSSIYKAIQAENPDIKDVNKIYVGQQIRLPAIDTYKSYEGKVVVVKPRDNLYRLALNNYGMVSKKIYAEILKANPRIRDIDLIKVGQRIVLPTLPSIPFKTYA